MPWRILFGTRSKDDGSLVRNKSNFTPESNRELNLDTFIKVISELPIIQKPKEKNKEKSINKQNHESLQNLINDKSIIIKEADKGRATVIMNTDFYEQTIISMKLLNDPNKNTWKQYT